MIFYDESALMLGKAIGDNTYFESGKKCALLFSGPYDSYYNKIEYSSYKIIYSINNVSSSAKSTLSDITTESNTGTNNVMVKLTNKGE